MFSPADVAANLNLSNGNRTVTSASAAYKTARASKGHSSGKRYFELTADVVDVSYPHWIKVGIILKSFSLATYIGTYATDLGYDGNGQKWIGASTSAYGTAWGGIAGSIVGVAVNFDNRTVEYFLNGVSQGIAATSITQELIYPAATLYGNTMKCSINCGDAPFLSIPPDFIPWNAD